MILATRYGNRELRFGEAMARIPSPSSWVSSSSGQPVTMATAVGLAAVGRAIRVVAGMAASMPIRVFEGRRGEKSERPETPQARLLEAPCYGVSDFDWRWDILSSLEACENAFLLKRKDGRGLVELELIPYYAVTATTDRKSGEKQFEVATTNGKRRFSESEILHIRGQTVGGGAFGVSRITQHRDPLGAMLAAQRFEGSYYRNHARPDVAFVFPENVSRAKALEWREEMNALYGGADNFGKPIPLGGGVKIEPIPLSMADSQFVETRRLGIEDVGRIMDVDVALIGGGSESIDARKTALQLFLQVQLPPRLRRIERALCADVDLFGGTSLYPEFEVSDLMFADPLTRARVQHLRVQVGTELVDEARADNGRPPLPPIPADPSLEPGKVPQLTPVGGAPTLPIPSVTEE